MYDGMYVGGHHDQTSTKCSEILNCKSKYPFDERSFFIESIYLNGHFLLLQANNGINAQCVEK